MDVKFSVNLFNREQLNIATKYITSFVRIGIDYGLFLEMDEHEINVLQEQIDLYVSLPVIYRNIHGEVYNKIKNKISRCNVSGVVVHDLDELAWTVNHLPDMDIITDTHIYVENNEALLFLQDKFADSISEFVIGYELNNAEIAKLMDSVKTLSVKSCIVGYGRTPMMISDGCLKKTYNKCDHKREISNNQYIKDRYNSKFPVFTDCNICTNIIYNDRPLCLFGYLDTVSKRGIDTVSLRFSLEDEEEVEQVLKAFVYKDSSAIAYIKEMETTTGHLKRGV